MADRPVSSKVRRLLKEAREAYDGDDTRLRVIHPRLRNDERISRWNDFTAILKWKADRKKFKDKRSERRYLHYDERQRSLVPRVTKEAFELANEFLRDGKSAKDSLIKSIALLDDLKGVDVRMATAILTFYDPQEFTVMDYRAWKALVYIRRASPFDFWFEESTDYPPYLERCKELNQVLGWKLRQTDHALWKLEDIVS